MWLHYVSQCVTTCSKMWTTGNENPKQILPCRQCSAGQHWDTDIFQPWPNPLREGFKEKSGKSSIITEVSRPSTANFRMFKILLLFIKNYLYRLHVTTTTYKWTLITMCTLQASCRHAAGQAKIPPLVWNHTSQIEKCISIFFQRGELFFGYSYCENKTCSENSMARAFR